MEGKGLCRAEVSGTSLRFRVLWWSGGSGIHELGADFFILWKCKMGEFLLVCPGAEPKLGSHSLALLLGSHLSRDFLELWQGGDPHQAGLAWCCAKGQRFCEFCELCGILGASRAAGLSPQQGSSASLLCSCRESGSLSPLGIEWKELPLQ